MRAGTCSTYKDVNSFFSVQSISSDCDPLPAIWVLGQIQFFLASLLSVTVVCAAL